MSSITGRLIAIVAAMTVVAAAGCATPQQRIAYDVHKANRQYVLYTRDELVRAKGEPDRREPLMRGEELWTYRASGTATFTRPRWQQAFSYSLEPTIEEPPKTVAWIAYVLFVVDRGGSVRDLKVWMQPPTEQLPTPSTISPPAPAQGSPPSTSPAPVAPGA